MPPDDESAYAVGYGKPPRHSRFEPGQSGNPRGRPPGSKNLSSLLKKALDEPVIVVENNRRRRIAKREAIVKQFVNQSAKGDLKATQLLLSILRDLESRAEPGSADADKITEADQQIIARIKARLGGADE
jgi:Family of unknown function (DUF5681)